MTVNRLHVAGSTIKASHDPVIEIYKKDIDRALVRRNLQRTVTERFEAAMALQRFADELRRAGREARKEP